LANFHNILELNIKMQQELFHWFRNAKNLNIWNLTKENEIHETKPEKITKRNEILLLTKQNETKRNEISLFILFRETSKISRNNFLFRFVSCFAKQKKGCEMETLINTKFC
jgi:hypothetical protein